MLSALEAKGCTAELFNSLLRDSSHVKWLGWMANCKDRARVVALPGTLFISISVDKNASVAAGICYPHGLLAPNILLMVHRDLFTTDFDTQATMELHTSWWRLCDVVSCWMIRFKSSIWLFCLYLKGLGRRIPLMPLLAKRRIAPLHLVSIAQVELNYTV